MSNRFLGIIFYVPLCLLIFFSTISELGKQASQMQMVPEEFIFTDFITHFFIYTRHLRKLNTLVLQFRNHNDLIDHIALCTYGVVVKAKKN